MLGEVQDVQGEELAHRPDHGHDTVSRQHDPAHGPFLTLAEGLGQDGVGMLGGQAVRDQVERAAREQGGVELVRIEEAFQAQGAILGRA